jgi:hypothetical protein
MRSLAWLDRVLAWYVSHVRVRNAPSHIYMAAIPPCECDLRWGRHPPFGVYHIYLRVGHCNTHTSQTAKDVRASQDTVIDVFERIEMFFRRLEIYTEVPPTTEMTDIIIQIMIEVLSILGIATKEIKQGRISKYSMKKQVLDD